MARYSGINQREIDKLVKGLAKGFEGAARRNPIRVPVQAEATALTASWNAEADLEEDLLLGKLLLWLDDYATAHPGQYAETTDFAQQEGLGADEAEVLVLALEQADLVKVLRVMGGDVPFMLSDKGRVQVRRLRGLQQDGGARLRYTINALLKWLFTVASDQRPVDPSEFLTTRQAFFAGAPVSAEDLDRSVAHLAQRELIELLDTTPATVVLTGAGIDTVLAGASVTTPSTRSGDNYTFNNSSNIVAGSQQSVVQNNTTGIDASALHEFAAVVKQFAPVLGIAPAEQAELIEDAEVLSDESADGSDPGRIRAAYDRVRARLDGITTVTAGLTTLAAQGQAAYQAVFGA
ncbi:hypothetical protein ACIBL6_20415 [Streptomyces sp. NPDC050400]|uniref:hypothetical protein n=1 Tax=Streptomyces sp. NPDC050400 TaxID=3365610 RepID=UPI0037A98DD5